MVRFPFNDLRNSCNLCTVIEVAQAPCFSAVYFKRHNVGVLLISAFNRHELTFRNLLFLVPCKPLEISCNFEMNERQKNVLQVLIHTVP